MVNADHLPDKSEKDMICYQVGIFEFYNVTADKLGEMKFSSPEMRELSKIDFMFDGVSDLAKLRDFFDGEFDNFKKIQVMDEDNIPF